jgi:hypothetical protein
MRATLLCALPFVFALACSSAEQPPAPQQTGAQTDAAAPAEPPAKPKRLPFDQRKPFVGDPAPPLSLETLAGSRVSLPGSNADRAAVLIFGSFS